MIRLITQPKVRLVGRQTIDAEAIDDFLRGEGVENWESSSSVAGHVLAEVAGRLCYKSFAKPRPGGNGGYLRHILEEGHGSILEHAVFNFIVSGVSRSFTHELVRHRAGFGYSQRSQRFVDEGELAVVVPPMLADEVAEAREYVGSKGGDLKLAWLDSLVDDLTEGCLAGLRWLATVDMARETYDKTADYLTRKQVRLAWARMGGTDAAHPDHIENILSEGAMAAREKTDRRKKAREAARSVLPNATETQIFVTANTRALRGMIEQRGVAGADREMRAVAVAFARVLMAEVPNIVPDYRIEEDAEGVEFVGFEWRKV